MNEQHLDHAPLVIAPAMNQVMWEAAATQRNLATLKADGVHLIGPEVGDQACGETGPGRMSELDLQIFCQFQDVPHQVMTSPQLSLVNRRIEENAQHDVNRRV